MTNLGQKLIGYTQLHVVFCGEADRYSQKRSKRAYLRNRVIKNEVVHKISIENNDVNDGHEKPRAGE